MSLIVLYNKSQQLKNVFLIVWRSISDVYNTGGREQRLDASRMRQ